MDVVQVLVREGADVNVHTGLKKPGYENKAGWAPLHWAAKNNHPGVISVLASAGAELNIEGSSTFHAGTPLHVAAGTKNRTEAVEALLKAGADVTVKDDLGNTPLHFSASRNAIDSSRLLLRYGADPTASNGRQQTPLGWVMQASRDAGTDTAKAMAPLRAVFEQEQNTSIGQWLRRHGMHGYAQAFIESGLTTIDEALAAWDMTSEKGMKELGIKNKKHIEKLRKLAKSEARMQENKENQHKSKGDL